MSAFPVFHLRVALLRRKFFLLGPAQLCCAPSHGSAFCRVSRGRRLFFFLQGLIKKVAVRLSGFSFDCWPANPLRNPKFCCSPPRGKNFRRRDVRLSGFSFDCWPANPLRNPKFCCSPPRGKNFRRRDVRLSGFSFESRSVAPKVFPLGASAALLRSFPWISLLSGFERASPVRFPAGINQKSRFGALKVFPLGASAALLRCSPWGQPFVGLREGVARLVFPSRD